MRRYVVVSLVVLAGCPDREVSRLDPVPVVIEHVDSPLEINNDVDILFVIDNSNSMDEEQTALLANFDRFIDVLDNLDGGLPDLHIGVVTSDMGGCPGIASADGALHVAADSLLGGDRYISDIGDPATGARITNFPQASTTLTDEFRKIATVGTAGCGYEQHLASMARAFTNPGNTGFLRATAHLAVVILADEDDCSVTSDATFTDPTLGRANDDFRCFVGGVTCDEDAFAPGPHHNCHPRDPSPYLHTPAEYVATLKALKSPAVQVIVAAITGDREPVIEINNPDHPDEDWPDLRYSCEYPNPTDPTDPQQAFPSVRIGAFVDGFAENGAQATICTDDLSGPIEEVGQLITNSVGNLCIKTDGVSTCTVEAVNGPGDADPFDQAIPACDASAANQPCWRLSPDPVHCDQFPTGLAIEIVGPAQLPDSTQIHAECVVE
jgi:hypothetical protein